MDRMTKIWAHRGASGYMPENTIEAFRLAAQMGADGVELDVQLSKDGQLVVTHDETLKRVGGVEKNVRDLTLAELKSLDVSRPIPGTHPAQIPTLAEVLEELRCTDLTVNIECKTGIWFYPGLEEKVVELIRDMGMTERIWCSSFNHRSVLQVKALCPEVKTGFLLADVLADAAAYAERYGVDAVHPALYQLQDERLLTRCREKKIAVHLWTVDDRTDMSRCFREKADAVITDRPDIAIEVYEEIQRDRHGSQKGGG